VSVPLSRITDEGHHRSPLPPCHHVTHDLQCGKTVGACWASHLHHVGKEISDGIAKDYCSLEPHQYLDCKRISTRNLKVVMGELDLRSEIWKSYGRAGWHEQAALELQQACSNYVWLIL
jgi:hypothetical protein